MDKQEKTEMMSEFIKDLKSILNTAYVAARADEILMKWEVRLAKEKNKQNEIDIN